jgi:hypothetical protein
MKKLLVFILVLGMASVATAQDAPQSGFRFTSQQNQPSNTQTDPQSEMDQAMFEIFPDKTAEYVFQHCEARLYTKKDKRKGWYAAVSADGYHMEKYKPEIGDSVLVFRGKIFYAPEYRTTGAILVERKGDGKIGQAALRGLERFAQEYQQYQMNRRY